MRKSCNFSDVCATVDSSTSSAPGDKVNDHHCAICRHECSIGVSSTCRRRAFYSRSCPFAVKREGCLAGSARGTSLVGTALSTIVGVGTWQRDSSHSRPASLPPPDLNRHSDPGSCRAIGLFEFSTHGHGVSPGVRNGTQHVPSTAAQRRLISKFRSCENYDAVGLRARVEGLWI